MKNKAENVLTLLEDRTNDYSNNVALGMKTSFGWRELTYNGLGLMSRRLASYLINDLNIQKDEKIAILSESKPEFGVCIFASIIAGTISVPLDIKLTIYELTSILSNCLPTVMMVSQAYLEKALELQKVVPSIKHIIVIDNVSVSNGLTSIYTIPTNYTCKWRHRSKNSTLFIIYTSGTTGTPKGVETSFGNVLAQLRDLRPCIDQILPNRDNVRILSILPMNHLYEMTVGFCTYLNLGYSVYYTKSLKPKDIIGIIRDRKIQFMNVVPAFLKLLKTSLEAEIKNSSKIYRATFPIKYKIAKFLPFKWLKKLMFKKLHDYFGGKFVGCISGGAPGDAEVFKFFRRIGFDIYQAYGLTETSPVATFNYDRNGDVTSVGRPLRGFKAKVNPETGELLLKGPSVMKGYYNQPELTAEVIDSDGWFHTGDIARIDKNGHVYITGRIKNMIVLSGGKKVFPEEVEAVLEKSPLFKELCVLGIPRTGGAKDGTEDIGVIVVPTDELIANNSKEELDKICRNEIKSLSKNLANYKRPVNSIVVSTTPLPRTATNKVQRRAVREMVQKA